MKDEELELTEELIDFIIDHLLWGDKESLLEMAKEGAKWNVNRKCIVFTL
jgi:hypothetical protein